MALRLILSNGIINKNMTNTIDFPTLDIFEELKRIQLMIVKLSK